jgi:heterodisulfide reductase subunit B/heterodisulfide reductase subunit C
VVLQLKLKTKDLFSDIDLGIKMLLKGKLKLLPSRVRDLKGVKAIFQKIDRLTRGEQP